MVQDVALVCYACKILSCCVALSKYILLPSEVENFNVNFHSFCKEDVIY